MIYSKQKYILLAFSLSLIILFLTDCAGKKEKIFTDYRKYYDKGVAAFERKKWDKAVENFNMALLNSPGGELADDAQFYLGECYFNKKEYLLAISEYQQLTERYTYSPLVEDAYYKIAVSYFKLSPKYQLDQESTMKSLQSLQDFLDVFPESKHREDVEAKIQEVRNKLARKLYESGCLYRKLEEWNSAIIYLDNLLETYYDTKWALDAKLEKAYCLIKLRKFDKYNKLISEINNDDNSLKLKERLEYLKILNKRERGKIAKELKKKQK
ncbi:MAG: hypothetical protein DRP89_03920 [Candidatus Neomarinimicrobiota bacterium]|nr:MAG: hypothetical protein DRP89_03920 [Candidatus Neomarinimicrobiota bacterium]